MSDKTEKNPPVLVIGDINRDLSASAEEKIQKGELQFGRITISLGGVGRNVAMNLRKLGVPVTFLTVVGTDPYSEKALEEAEKLKIDMSHALILENENLSGLLYFVDKEGELHAGIEDLHSLSHISPDYLKGKADLINEAKWCMVSGNLPRESLKYLIENHIQTRFLFDPASEKMAKEVRDIVGKFHTVKPNKEEAEILSETEIKKIEDAKQAAKTIREKGSNQVILTLEEGGAVYFNGKDWTAIETPSVNPVSSTGAGDSFSAALLYCFNHQLDLDYSVRFAIAASTLTLQSKEAVHPEFSVERVEQMMKELEI